jgi:hypothetical protein
MTQTIAEKGKMILQCIFQLPTDTPSIIASLEEPSLENQPMIT